MTRVGLYLKQNKAEKQPPTPQTPQKGRQIKKQQQNNIAFFLASGYMSSIPPSALLSLRKLSFTETALRLCPSQLMKH